LRSLGYVWSGSRNAGGDGSGAKLMFAKSISDALFRK
jgi:hypothetical protein